MSVYGAASMTEIHVMAMVLLVFAVVGFVCLIMGWRAYLNWRKADQALSELLAKQRIEEKR